MDNKLWELFVQDVEESYETDLTNLPKDQITAMYAAWLMGRNRAITESSDKLKEALKIKDAP